MQTFYCPVRLYMGPDALQALTRETAKRVMIVTDRYFSQNGLAQKIGAMIPGAEVQIFDKVVPDPPASLAAEGAALCSRFRPELLMALGGGSPMDCAKAIRLASETPMRFVAIPTTSGSGSEMTAFSILTHEGVKHPVIDDAMRPDAAILDDTLLQELPASLAADTGMDLLAHCLEAVAAARHRSMASVTLKSAITPYFMGRIAAMFCGTRLNILFASVPTAMTSLVLVLNATTEGSEITIPRSFI